MNIQNESLISSICSLKAPKEYAEIETKFHIFRASLDYLFHTRCDPKQIGSLKQMLPSDVYPAAES